MELVNTLQQKNEELQKLYITDRLTGLFNRYKLDEALDNELQRTKRFNHPFSIIILDIDHFKSVNDIYGHQTGDSVLIEIATILQRNIRVVDILGRWGGEEFLIICPETSKNGAAKLAENIRKSVANFHFQGVGKKTASFGVAEYRIEENLKEFITRADTALYQAKEKGRDKVECG